MPRLVAVSSNIHRGVGIDGRQAPERIAAVLAPVEADFIALQEVHAHHHQRRGWLHQLDYLAAETGMTPVPGPTLVRHAGEYGNGLLTRLPVAGVRQLDLSHFGREPRNALDVILDAGGVPLAVVVTHLGLLALERDWQVEQLLPWLQQSPAEALVLMGDFNEWRPRSRLAKRLDGVLGKGRAPATFPSFLPFLALDRVWVRAPARLLALSTMRGLGARIASDHLPLKVVLEV